jgi:hypothetical protein
VCPYEVVLLDGIGQEAPSLDGATAVEGLTQLRPLYLLGYAVFYDVRRIPTAKAFQELRLQHKLKKYSIYLKYLKKS